RGDDLNYLVDRIAGPYRFEVTGTYDPHAEVRERLQGSEIRISADKLLVGGTLELTVQLRYQGDPVTADLFIAVRPPDGVDRFLPDMATFAVPFQTDLQLS